MRDCGPTVVMRAEHRETGRWLEALHEKVRTHDVATHQEEDALCRTLLAHNQKEESVLYPAMDRQLRVIKHAARAQRAGRSEYKESRDERTSTCQRK